MRQRGLCSEGLAMMMTWSSPRNTCFLCESHAGLGAYTQVKSHRVAITLMQFCTHTAIWFHDKPGSVLCV